MLYTLFICIFERAHKDAYMLSAQHCIISLLIINYIIIRYCFN